MTMDHAKSHAPGSTGKMAQDADNEAVSIARAILSREVADETVSFMVDVSRQLYPHTMRINPHAPAATSLKEFHFSLLMRQAFEFFAVGRGQDFSDTRFILHDLLREEPEHKPLADRFCRLMGLWMQDAHNKRQREVLELEQRLRRQAEERKMRAEQEKGTRKAENRKNAGTNVRVHDKKRPNSSKNASLPNANKQHSVVRDDAGTSTAYVLTKNVFDLAGVYDCIQ